jgi:SAM-dependent methyltransferase
VWSDPDLYEMENADDPAFDLEYWSALVRSLAPARMLELAAGTGRLTIPLASLGVVGELVALDSSEPFVERLRGRVGSLPVTVVCGDMRAPAFDGRFDLVAIPFNSLAYLMTRDDRLACLRACRELLAPGGRLAFDLVMPRYDFIAEALRDAPPTRVDADHPSPDHGATRFVRSYTDTYDEATQTLRSTNRYEISYADGRVEHRITDLDWHIYFPEELTLLLEACGLQVLERYGDYARAPWTTASRRYLWLAGAR